MVKIEFRSSNITEVFCAGNAVSIRILHNRHSNLDLNPSFTNLLICLVSCLVFSKDNDFRLKNQRANTYQTIFELGISSKQRALQICEFEFKKV